MKSIRRLLRMRDPHDRRLVVFDDGVELRDAVVGDVLWRVEWKDLVEIAAFKGQSHNNDILMCLGLLTEGNKNAFRADELIQGWDGLLRVLVKRYPPDLDTRYRQAVNSPMGKSFTVLWSRDSGAPPAATPASE